MTAQEPPWLKRTRPCPFFSQGRCLFADSCNFLHDVRVRSAVTQPLRSTIHDQQPFLLQEPAFGPPSVVINSASPRSDDLLTPQSPSGSVRDSSRYSGLLSVLCDVIGPPSDPSTVVEGAVPASQTMSTVLSGFHSTANDCAEPPLKSDSSELTISATTGMGTGQGTPSSAELSEAMVIDSFGHRPEAFPSRVDSTPATEDGNGDTTTHFVEATEAYVIGSDTDDEDMDNYGEEDPTVMLSNRQSTFSSFTGASLLASPQHSILGDPSAAGLAEGGVVDLLSPVELSAKLRPFSISSVTSKIKRADSIDSGYADGDSWVSPLPFPRSPPRSFQSPVTFLSLSRRASFSSLGLRERRVSYNVTLHPSSRPIGTIQEVESDGRPEVGGAYGASPSEEQGGGGVSLHASIVEEKVEEDDKLAELPTVNRSPMRFSPEYLHPTREYDLDSSKQLSFISDDNMSFKTALSTQPSFDDLSDISRVSPIKQDSLLSFISGCSTPDTSVFSHYGDASDLVEQSTVGSHVSESFCTVGRIEGTELPETRVSEECACPEEVVSNVPSVSATANDLQGHVLEQLVAPGGSRSASGSSMDTSHGPLSAKDVLGCASQNMDGVLGRLSVNTVAPQGQLSGGFVFNEHISKSIPSTESHHSSSPTMNSHRYTSSANDTQGFAVENGPAPQKHPPNVLQSFLRSCSPGVNTRSPFMVKDAPEHTPDTAGSNFSSSQSLSTVSDDDFAEHSAAEVDRSLVMESSSVSDEVSEFLDSDCGSFTQCLSFPLPPPFLPTELVGHSALSGEEGTSVPSEGAVTDLEMDVSSAHAMSQNEEMTEKARPSRLPSVGSPESNVDFTSQRSRAASDITVKAKSPPVTVLTDASDISDMPLSPSEQPGHSDSVQSLYDQYFDDDTFDDGSESSSLVHKDVAFPDVSGPIQELSQESHLQTHGVSSSASDSEPGRFDIDSPLSETILRPLLMGRPFVRSSLAGIIPKTNDKESSSLRTRLLTREAGSTMVPLGFRRHKPQPTATRTSRPLHVEPPSTQLREILRIRTDVARNTSPPGCSSAIHIDFATRSPLPEKAMSAPPTGGLRQLCLSSTINKRSSILSTHSSSIESSIVSLDQLFNSSAPQSPSVSSTTSFSRNSSLSPSCTQIPEHMHHTLKCSSSNPLLRQTNNTHFTSHPLPHCDSRSVSAPTQLRKSWRLSHYRAGSRNHTLTDGTRHISKSSTPSLPQVMDGEQETNEDGTTMTYPIQSRHADDWACPASVLATPVHAIATPRPNLLFAIASDDVDQVRRVLENGDAGPNDSVGPQSALAFTLTNDKLAHKQEIVKALLAYGANPAALRNPASNPAPRIEGSNEPTGPPSETTLEGMDPATRYFVSRADTPHTRQTSQLIYRSLFRPLTRVRYDVIGQDWALEQLFRVLNVHSQKLAVAPIVVLLCGPSGHGKSLLARKFGSLLDVPTHTVNMTTLRSAHDIWQSYSMSPYEEPSSCTLAEFLIENEGKRCVVVLDEIEKVEDQKALWSLLMPWELGRCSLEAGKRHIDARNVIWLGTSNIGHELVSEYHENRAEPDERMSREDYVELTAMLRPRVSHRLGASLVSRVTAVLPFVPFTLDEKKAIAAEAVYALAGDASRTLSPQDIESLVNKALPSYHPSEGARSLHRAISNVLVNVV